MKLISAAVLLTYCGLASGTAFAAAAFTLETVAPAGFEELTAPQSVVADIYYGGRLLGAGSVSVSPGTLAFEDPSAVAQLLPQTRAPERVWQLLGQPLAVNAHRACRSRQQQDCGFIDTDSLAIIYDAERFRVDIFIAPEFLPQTAAIDDPYLPGSSSGFSFIQNLTASWSGVDSSRGGNNGSAALYGRSIASYGESGIHSRWSYASEGQGRIYESFWSRDYRGRSLSLGLIQPQQSYSYFSPAPYFYGVEYRSSSRSRIDTEYGRGAPLEINMPLRGRIELYRDGNLLESQILEAGNQMVDTSNLPGGAYDLEVRVYDDSGRALNRYTQMFVKDTLLPAPDEWRWSIQAGQPARYSDQALLPGSADTSLLQASVARRLTGSTGLTISAAATEQEQMLELGGRWVGEHVELSPAVVQTGDGRSGYRLSVNLRTDWFNLYASEMQLEERPTPAVDSFNLLFGGYLQRNMGVSGQLLGGQATLRFSETDRAQTVDAPGFELEGISTRGNTLTTFEYRRQIYRKGPWQGDLTLSHSDADGLNLTTASLQFRFGSGRVNHSARVRTESERMLGQTTRAGFQSTWRDQDLWPLDVRHQFQAEAGGDDYYLSSDTTVAGRLGRANSTVLYRNSTQFDAINYIGSFSTSVLATPSHLSWGGENTLDSAVIIDIDGSSDQDFEILVNGTRRGYAAGGTRSVISLPSFDTYDVALRPLSEGFYQYDEHSESVTLYPGNIGNTSYQVRRVVVVLGRLMDGEAPVTHRKISIGEFSAVTDEFGNFQIEMKAKPGKWQVPPVRWRNCEVPLPEQSAGEHWINLGSINIENAACPAVGTHYAQK